MHSKTNNGKHINGIHGKQINYNMKQINHHHNWIVQGLDQKTQKVLSKDLFLKCKFVCVSEINITTTINKVKENIYRIGKLV